MAGALEQLDGRGNSVSAKLLGYTLEGLKHGVQHTEILPSSPNDYFDLAAKLRKDLQQ